MKLRIIIKKLYLSLSVLAVVFTLFIIFVEGFTHKEIKAKNTYERVQKSEAENKKTDDGLGFIPCYDYLGNNATDKYTCLTADTFKDGSIIKGVVFDILALLAVIASLTAVYYWAGWVFRPDNKTTVN